MVYSTSEEFQAIFQPDYDRQSELKAFDDTKASVKGIVDAGNTKVPRIFIHTLEYMRKHNPSSSSEKFIFPVIDLPIKHCEIVDKVRSASETWGFFQVVNHEIPVPVCEEMLPRSMEHGGFPSKMSRLRNNIILEIILKKVAHFSNFDFYSTSALFQLQAGETHFTV